MRLKYPSTYHFPFSPEIHRDDKTHENPEIFLNRRVIITEKLDGGNCLIYNGNVFPRSVEKTNCPSFNYIKNNHSYKTISDYKLYFGENVFAKHSISYTLLTDYFYLFSIIDENKIFLDFDSIVKIGSEKLFKIVPILYDGIFKSLSDIKDWMDLEIKKPSSFGLEREGFVLRVDNSFNYCDFEFFSTIHTV